MYTPGSLYNMVCLIQHRFGYNTDHCCIHSGHIRLFLLYVYLFYSDLDPNNSARKRLTIVVYKEFNTIENNKQLYILLGNVSAVNLKMSLISSTNTGCKLRCIKDASLRVSL